MEIGDLNRTAREYWDAGRPWREFWLAHSIDVERQAGSYRIRAYWELVATLLQIVHTGR